MRRILDVCLQYGIFVMVDETYVEFAPEPRDISSVSLTNYYTNLIILRGTSKFFACPWPAAGICDHRQPRSASGN